MQFQNENTLSNAGKEGKTGEFHKSYDDAVIRVKKDLGRTYPLLIDGRQKLSDGGVFEDTSPIEPNLVLGYFQRATKDDVDESVEAAKAAFPRWSGLDYGERNKILLKAADLIRSRKFETAALMTLENGKNRYEAVADVDEAIDMLRYYAWEMERNNGFEMDLQSSIPDEKSKSILKPYGVWGVIAPFNFPLAIATGMSSGALATGNTVVFKPSSATPLMGHKLSEALRQAGIPDGVFNYLTGSGEEVGADIVKNDEVSGIVFTGSREVGVSIYNTFSSKRPKPVISEMGGKNPIIVTSKADLTKAAEGVARAAFSYGGQKCSACSRVYVEESVRKEFTKLLVEQAKRILAGDTTIEKNYLGPLINGEAVERYKAAIEVAKRDGTILVGGRVPANNRGGYFVEPTVVADLPDSHRLIKEELFVPIVCLAEIGSLVEGIEKGNDVDYGLTAGIFSEDRSEVQAFFDGIEAGVIYANRRSGGTTGASVRSNPFVGWKLSGSSGKGAGGSYYLQQFLREQMQSEIVTGNGR